jgi:hypothetical protein
MAASWIKPSRSSCRHARTWKRAQNPTPMTAILRGTLERLTLTCRCCQIGLEYCVAEQVEACELIWGVYRLERLEGFVYSMSKSDGSIFEGNRRAHQGDRENPTTNFPLTIPTSPYGD